MGRRLLTASITVGVLFAIGVTASLAASGHASSHRPVRFGATRWSQSASISRKHFVTTAATFVVAQGFTCGVPVGTGPNDQTITVKRTNNSVAYNANGPYVMSCIGKLSSSATWDHSKAVAHNLVMCRIPTGNGGSVVGQGITITFKNGMYDETCNSG